MHVITNTTDDSHIILKSQTTGGTHIRSDFYSSFEAINSLVIFAGQIEENAQTTLQNIPNIIVSLNSLFYFKATNVNTLEYKQVNIQLRLIFLCTCTSASMTSDLLLCTASMYKSRTSLCTELKSKAKMPCEICSMAQRMFEGIRHLKTN